MARKKNVDPTGNSQSSRNRAYLSIQRKIASGELPAGGAVSELALAKELGISRTPIRESIGQLIAEGLLEQSPNRGVVVVQMRRSDIVDLYELREALEVYVVGKVARQQIARSDLARLRKLADETLVLKDELTQTGATTLNAEQMHRQVASDLSFHTLLMRLAGNIRILKVVNETRLLIRIFAMKHRGHEVAELEEIHRQHGEILHAVAERDPERAMNLLTNHIQASRQERLSEFDHWEHEASLRENLPVFFGDR